MQDFATVFEALTGYKPFPWQTALYDCFLAGDMPASVNIPTGLGKTSVLAIWLLALANKPGKVPRRLVYVVNRRTVVDQTTTEAESLRAAVAKPELNALKQRLLDLCALSCKTPLAISTLRGQFADNGEWQQDPARPSVIIGTVDMIGSGLLFSRYTAGFKTRPLHAGFLGQDALIVHDEAHLEPAFQTLLEEIAAAQSGPECSPTRLRDLKPVHLLALTATSRSEAAPFTLTDTDRANPTVKKRVDAVKRLSLVALGEEDKLEERITEKAKSLNGAVLVFVHSVESALKIVEALDKGEHKGRVIPLTGTMRGEERDELVKDSRFQRFLGGDGSTNRPPVFLVCTSAGEVGVNLSADHCVCDLSTYESMAQRFGRVNRFGERDDSTITVMHTTTFDTGNVKTGPFEVTRERTLALLQRLPQADSAHGVREASPAALEILPAAERAAAFSPQPVIRVAAQIQFDAWALTSIREPIAARPPVAPYLHGEAKWQPPEAHLAWRADDDFKHITDPADFLATFPLRPQELLRDTAKRIAATLAKLLKSNPDAQTTPVWFISENGSITQRLLGDFSNDDAASVLADATLILPVTLGGLEKGHFTGKGSASDVSGIIRRTSDTRDTAADFVLDVTNENDEEPRYLHWFAPSSAQTERQPLAARGAVSLAAHTAAVTANARAIAAKLGFSADLQSAIVTAAEHHDDGKARAHWQRAIGNRAYPATVLAKSSDESRSSAEVYRHEFGSLSWNANVPSATDLAAHIVASHHGRARPHFPAVEIFDPERPLSESLALASSVPIRFAALQRTYGRWGLAYLESILRAADYAASSGLVADATTALLATPSPSGQPALPQCETGTVSLALDPKNPGHYFACCGLFELTSRLHPEATAHFDGDRFIIHAPTTLAALFEMITSAEIKDVDDSDKPLTPIRIATLSLYLDWWRYEGGGIGKLKTWAGQMSVCGIANDMRQAIVKEIVCPDCRLDQILFCCSQVNAGQPYYFDANYAVNAQAQDVGFSIDKLGKGGVNIIPATRPAVEFLCLIGLQRARPLLAVNEKGKERLYDYNTWEKPIPVSLVPAAVAGLLSHNGKHYRFANPSRAKDYRAFMPANLLNP